jgi:hypothetical protein
MYTYCSYLRVCVYMYIYIYIYTHIDIHIYLWTKCVCVYMYTFSYVPEYICTQTRANFYTQILTHIAQKHQLMMFLLYNMLICILRQTYIYIHAQTHIHTNAYVLHMHIDSFLPASLDKHTYTYMLKVHA